MPSGARARRGGDFACLGPAQLRSRKDLAPRAPGTVCGSCGWCDRANPLPFPAPVATSHADVLQIQVAPKPPNPSGVPGPLPSPPSKQDIKSREASRALGFFFLAFFCGFDEGQ